MGEFRERSLVFMGIGQINIEEKEQADIEYTSTDLQSEIQEFITVSQQRRKLLPRAALVGLCSGLVASLFRVSLAGADLLRNAFLDWAHQFPALGWLFPLIFSATGAVISIVLVRNFAPEASGSGIPHLEAVLQRLRSLTWKRVLPVKFIAGTFALGSGLALGREGPTVQMGGAVGDAISGWLKSPPREKRTLIAAGAGAGLAAAFNAPLSGLTFVLEEVQRDFHPIVFAAAFVAAIVADIVARILSGSAPVFSVPGYAALPITALPFFGLLGILAGLLGVIFNHSLIAVMNFMFRFKGPSIYFVTALVGGFAGVISWFSPIAVGGGHALTELVLAGRLSLGVIPLWIFIRLLLTTMSYGTGTAGGIFAPLLVLGALVGLATGQSIHYFVPNVVSEPAVFAVVGMAAIFTAIVRAPLTGILLIVEMTGSYEQMLPLLVSCFCAYVVAEFLKTRPIYQALLERDLKKNSPQINLQEPMVIDFEIAPGAPFDGRKIRFLGLPSGCVIVRCIEQGKEFIPTADTRLEANMKITAFIAPEASSGLKILRDGCKST